MVEKYSISKGSVIKDGDFLEVQTGLRHDQQFVEAVNKKLQEGWKLVNTSVGSGARIAHFVRR